MKSKNQLLGKPWRVAAVLAMAGPLACWWASAQEKPPTFDVASVKPATLPAGVTVTGEATMASRGTDMQRLRNVGGPGTNDPGRIHYPLISLKALLLRAYDSYFEIRGPGWLDTEVVQVDATMPSSTTKEQFRQMLASLITDRFQLKSHVESKEITGYSLVVAKDGPKMKESADLPAPQDRRDDAAPPAPRPRGRGPDGFPIPPPGPTFGFMAVEGQRARIIGQQQALDKLVEGLGNLLKCPVTDATGLKANYDFTVTYSGGFGSGGPYAQLVPPATDGAATAGVSAPEPAPDIFSALQSQLGLKLEPKKVPVQVLVIDHMEKTPAGN
jgi:uncharacterized protein (TIGR03435 family)